MPLKQVYGGNPPDGGIPANEIVSLSPAQQGAYDGQPFIMAAFKAPPGTNNERLLKEAFDRNGGKANEWALVKQPAGTRPGYDWQGGTGFEVVRWQGAARPAVPLYGVVGGPSDGVVYNPSTGTFYRDVADLPGLPGTGASTGTTQSLPPGPSQAAGTTATATPTYEFSVSDSGLWVALTPASSARKVDGNPHPGISIINPGQWEISASGLSVREATPELDMYRETGWSGLDKRVLSWQGDGVVTPSGEEISSAIVAALNGDEPAQRALARIGVKPPAQSYRQQRGLGLNLSF